MPNPEQPTPQDILSALQELVSTPNSQAPISPTLSAWLDYALTPPSAPPTSGAPQADLIQYVAHTNVFFDMFSLAIAHDQIQVLDWLVDFAQQDARVQDVLHRRRQELIYAWAFHAPSCSHADPEMANVIVRQSFLAIEKLSGLHKNGLPFLPPPNPKIPNADLLTPQLITAKFNVLSEAGATWPSGQHPLLSVILDETWPRLISKPLIAAIQEHTKTKWFDEDPRADYLDDKKQSYFIQMLRTASIRPPSFTEMFIHHALASPQGDARMLEDVTALEQHHKTYTRLAVRTETREAIAYARTMAKASLLNKELSGDLSVIVAQKPNGVHRPFKI